MSERFHVTKSEETVLFRNYGSTVDEETDNDVYGKSDGAHVIIGNNHLTVNREEEERDTGRKN